MGEGRLTGEQVEGRGGQRVLVGPPVEFTAHQLLRCGIRHRADGHVGGGEPADVVDPAGDAEVRQQNSLLTGAGAGQQDVGGLDIAVQQAALMGVVEGVCDRPHDRDHLGRRQTGPVAVPQQLRGVGALHVIHGDPDLTVVLAAVVDADDVRMPQRRGDIGFPVEPLSVLVVR